MDDITRRFRDANPYRDGRLPSSAEPTLAKILEYERPTTDVQASSTRTRRKLPVLLSGAAVLAVLLITSMVAVFQPAHKALAVAPNPLPTRPATQTIDDLRAEVSMSDTPTEGSSKLGSSLEGWYFIFDVDSPASTFIQPQKREVIANPDGSGVSRLFAGTPVDANGIVITPVPSGASEPGSLIEELKWGAGELYGGFTETPPETTEAMKGYLNRYLHLNGFPTDTTYGAADYAQAAVSLLQTWTLSPAAEKALIAVVLSGDGVGVRGSTVDRAGRAGLLIELGRGTHQAEGVSEQLVIDTKSWKILAAETISTDGNPEMQLSPGSVISYTIWR